ncbi:hypothetical protein TIFTF001_005754 [Ficus carica]|uniref:Uncharacterized protein n=1 Tax=Ficus carica TaxID=3494 RepID=A0AA87ZPH6_FICCA|nr:hypothetical protein TIFTF001_005754 [Ficus carica]
MHVEKKVPDTYIGHMVLHGYSEEIMYRAFRNTLFGAARRCVIKLQPNSITSWEDLKRAFSNQFLGVKSIEVVAIEEISDKEALMGAMSSMRHDIPFRDDLNQKPTKMYQEFLERAQGFINAKEAKSLAHKSKIVVLKTTSKADQLNGKQNGKNKRREQRNTESAKQAEWRGNYRQDLKKQRLHDEPK